MSDSQEAHYKLLLDKGDLKRKKKQLGVRSQDGAY